MGRLYVKAMEFKFEDSDASESECDLSESSESDESDSGDDDDCQKAKKADLPKQAKILVH